MHPSRAIRGKRSQLLAGRRIVLGISGSIAAVEVPRIARELIRHGADVRAVMSGEATRLITPEAIQFATGHPPILQLTGDVEHVSLLGPGEGRADLLLIAPATANTLSKIAHGIDDTAVTSFASVALGGGVPILVAPAMHEDMGRNPAIRENLERLRQWGVGVIGPTRAEGEEKLASPEEVAAEVLHRLARGPLAGRRVLVIGGASREAIDAVRSVTNESSGETAAALASQAYYRGAHVELWAGAMEVALPSFIPATRWRSVADLRALIRAANSSVGRSDVILIPAALADYTLEAQRGKISSRDHAEIELHLTRAPKILPEIRERAPPPALIVGFKLEADLPMAELTAAAAKLRDEYDLDWVVANDRTAMGSHTTALAVTTRRGGTLWLQGPKAEVAGKLLDDLAREMAELGGESPATPAEPRRTRHRRSPRASRARGQ
jgi:phosphopantothenoylcysteine decarboxylase / phosphopantothenate---cysteine ligase